MEHALEGSIFFSIKVPTKDQGKILVKEKLKRLDGEGIKQKWKQDRWTWRAIRKNIIMMINTPILNIVSLNVKGLQKEQNATK